MATILEFLQKYAVQSSNYGGYLKLLKVIQDCHQNYCFKLCILEETPNLWPWKYGDHNTQWILSISMDHNYSVSQKTFSMGIINSTMIMGFPMGIVRIEMILVFPWELLVINLDINLQNQNFDIHFDFFLFQDMPNVYKHL